MKSPAIVKSRRWFISQCAKLGLGSTLLPGVLWAKVEAAGTTRVTAEMVKASALVAGLDFAEADCQSVVAALNERMANYAALRQLHLPYTVRPPLYFSPWVEGLEVDRMRRRVRLSEPSGRKRPRDLEEVAYWPIVDQAELIRTRAVSSSELTRMYLGRLRRYNTRLNCVVTLLDDLASAQAAQADAEIAAGNYRGPLHGIPWGVKDLMAVKDYPTTWGSGIFKEQVFSEEATVVTLLREAGAVLLAKLSTGELAGSGDRWFGGRTNNPWNPAQGSTGSSAGSAAATAAGLVAFSLGTDTGGSILSPSARCGATGLRPTFGRVSCHGVMPRSWSADRVGPICRSVEDCAIVMSAIARPDGRDFSVSDLPFNWDARAGIKRLRVGFVEEAFAETGRQADWIRNDRVALDQVRALGVTLVPLRLPDFPLKALQFSVEAAAAFDELLRSGRSEQLSFKYEGNDFRSARFVPAVEFLQAQRARMMMMNALATASAGVDVYLAPAPVWPDLDTPGAGGPDSSSPTQRHYTMASLAGYPALAVPNGITASGTPTSITFMARPFGDSKLMTLAKAYQDSGKFHLRHPVL